MGPIDVHSRRTFLLSTGLICATPWLMPRAALARRALDEGVVPQFRRDGAAAKLEVQALRGNIHVLMGAGGNIGVRHGDEGILLVDSGVAGAEPHIAAALAAISTRPIGRLVNTHWHFDHTDGNEWAHGQGAQIVAHENTARRLSISTRVEGWQFTFPPSPPGAIPSLTITADTTLNFNGKAVLLQPMPPSHTDTDVRVTFTDADVVQTGDTWWNGHYPFIDYSTGGSFGGTLRAAEANVEYVSAKTLVIPGHGPVGGKKELIEFRDMLRTIGDAVAALKKQGKSADEAVAAKPTATYDAKWGTFVIGPDVFTRLVYAGV